jgi:hypothetical protein
MPKDSSTHWLSEDQLAVLVGTRTQEVWDCFIGAQCMSAADVQSKLRFDSKAVYYQVEKLVKAGLLVPCAENSGKAARFRKVAAHVHMPPGFQGERYEKLAAKLMAAKMRKSMRQFQKAAELAPERPELVDALFVAQAKLTISTEKLKELNSRLRELILEYSRDSDAGLGTNIRALFVITPDL